MRKNTGFSMMMIVLGSLLFAIAINMFNIPNNLGEGGVTGVSLILFYLLHVPVSVVTFVINGFILLIGWKYLDKNTILLTVLVTVLMSVFLHLTEDWNYFADNIAIVPLVAGTLVGFSQGIIMQSGATTAGSDIVALIMNKYLGISTSAALLMLDTVVVLPSIFVIGLENVVWTILYLYVQTKVLDFVLEGFNPKKSVLVISDHYEKIGEEIDKRIGRGITLLDGQGFFSRSEKKILMVIINRQQLMPLTRLISAIDPKAFVVISEVQNVVGEGFTYIVSDEESREKIKEFVETGQNSASKKDL